MKVNKSILALLLMLLASMSVATHAQYKFEVRSLDFDKIQPDGSVSRYKIQSGKQQG